MNKDPLVDPFMRKPIESSRLPRFDRPSVSRMIAADADHRNGRGHEHGGVHTGDEAVSRGVDDATGEVVVPTGSIGFRWGEQGKWNLELKDGLDGSAIAPATHMNVLVLMIPPVIPSLA